MWTWAIDADASGFSTILVSRAARSAANVVVKTQGELLLQLYGLFDEPQRLSPEGVSLMLGRLPRAAGKPRLSLSTPAVWPLSPVVEPPET